MNKRKRFILIVLCFIIYIFGSMVYHNVFKQLVDSQTLALLQRKIDTTPNFVNVLTADGYAQLSDGTYHKGFLYEENSSATHMITILVEADCEFSSILQYRQKRKPFNSNRSLYYFNTVIIEYQQFRITITETTTNRNTENIARELQNMISSDY